MNSPRTSRIINSTTSFAPVYTKRSVRSIDSALDKASPRWLTATPVNPQILLSIQQHTFLDQPCICVCDTFHAAQRYAYEILLTKNFAKNRTFVIHEMMPAYQQNYIIACLNSTHTSNSDHPIVVFTSNAYYPTITDKLPWLKNDYEHVIASPLQYSNIAEVPNSIEPTVSCICLRTGYGGRWILMDHEEATTISSVVTPNDDIANRLLNHTIQLTGNRLAPYMAMMFDVPQAWRSHPNLVAHSLLIFNKDVCPTGCTQPGIPRQFLWSEIFGIIHDN